MLGCLEFLPKAGEQCSDGREVLQVEWYPRSLALAYVPAPLPRPGHTWLSVSSLDFPICKPGLTILLPSGLF